MLVPLDEEDKIIVRCGADLYTVMRKILMRENKIERQQEHFWVTSLSIINRIMVVELVSLGSINECLITPMQVFRIPLIKGAVSVIMVHNHCCEYIVPSEEDLDATDRMIQIGNYHNVQVLDHLIINETEFTSFDELGLMDKLRKSKKWVVMNMQEVKEDAQKIGEEIGEKKGYRKGKREGKKEGKQIGLEQGMEKGKKEEKNETAKNLLTMGIDIDIIAKATGLKKHEIEKLRPVQTKN
jgi:DNA repair protein RadC